MGFVFSCVMLCGICSGPNCQKAEEVALPPPVRDAVRVQVGVDVRHDAAKAGKRHKNRNVRMERTSCRSHSITVTRCGWRR